MPVLAETNVPRRRNFKVEDTARIESFRHVKQILSFLTEDRDRNFASSAKILPVVWDFWQANDTTSNAEESEEKG